MQNVLKFASEIACIWCIDKRRMYSKLWRFRVVFRYRTPIVCHSNIFPFGFSKTIYENIMLLWWLKTKHQYCSFTFLGLSLSISGSFLLIHCSDFVGSSYIFWTVNRDRRRHKDLWWYSNGQGKSGNKCYHLCSPKTTHIWKKSLF